MDFDNTGKAKNESPKGDYTIKPTKNTSLSRLRDIATSSTPTEVDEKTKLISVKYRSDAIRLYAKKRANGHCEGCGLKAPFETNQGPYLEVHHLTRLSDGGADLPENVIAVCPTCHRRAHYSLDSKEYNERLREKVKEFERNLE